MEEPVGPEAGLPAHDLHAERESERQEGLRRCQALVRGVLEEHLPPGDDRERATVQIVNALFVTMPVDGDEPCRCSCHASLPEGFHDFGTTCDCQQTAKERQAHWDDWRREIDAYWDSPEGRAVTARHDAEEAELQEWLTATPDMTVTSHGGWAPEQWEGTVAGHSFYFRERHGEWRIEVDLRPTGNRYRVYVGGERDEDSSYEWRDSTAGTVIAEGGLGTDGYGETPRDRARFLYRTVGDHAAQVVCQIHLHEREDLELLSGRPLNSCPACGVRLFVERPARWD